MSVPGPTLGPCEVWIDGDDVAECCGLDPSSNSAVFDDVAIKTSMLLFELSGRQFTGLCDRIARPCADPCGCSWGAPGSSSSWYWGNPGAPGWRNECGDSCGCGSLSRVKLGGYPVREISEVKVDGEIVDPTGYRLDAWRYLVRLDDPGPPVVKRRWPACQNLALDDDQPGTFSVAYRHGVDPPPIALQAASELACRLFQTCQPGAGSESGVLPVGVAKVVRQGIELEQGLLVQFLYSAKPTGLVAVDGFLSAYGVKGRRTAVWSPDIQPFARSERV